MDWIYSNHFPEDSKDFENISMSIFKDFSVKTKSITKEAFKPYEVAYEAYLISKGHEPFSKTGCLRKRATGCLTPAAFHNLFLLNFFTKQLNLQL